MQLAITEHGDYSVGIFDRWYLIDCPFDEDADDEMKEQFATDMIRAFTEYCEMRLTTEYIYTKDNA